jgi:hypothetical protein
VTASNRDPLQLVDHLVWGGLDLETEIAHIERITGVRAALGGRHPGEGTRNALIRIGEAAYLELIAPDLDQPPPPHPRWLGLDTLTTPRLVTWAAKSRDLDAEWTTAQAAGVPLGDVRSGRRELGNGRALSWRLTYPDMRVGDGLIPFLIEWGDSPHPAQTAPKGLELVGLHAEHPTPAVITQLLMRLGCALPVVPGHAPALIATLDTPRGRIELR